MEQDADAERLEARANEVLEWLERDVWPLTKSLRALSKSEEEALLGYDDPPGSAIQEPM